jgi:hypothetical protein
VDGERVLISGDQYSDADGLGLNYVYGNEFEVTDYARSAELYARVAPTLILSGHWEPRRVETGYFAALQERGRDLERLHRELLNESAASLGSSGFVARLTPYQLEVGTGERFTLEVRVRNPFEHAIEARVEMIAPEGWRLEENPRSARLEPFAEVILEFRVVASEHPVRRARIAVDVTLGERRFGQVAEALVSLCQSAREQA